MSDEPVNGTARFDAGSLEIADDASTEIEIIDPRTKQGTGIKITVLSRDSEKARTVTRSQLNRRFRTMGRGRNAGPTLTAEELDMETLDLLVACTQNWQGMLWGGKELECSAQNARMVYSRSPIIREQVDDAISDRALFTKS